MTVVIVTLTCLFTHIAGQGQSSVKYKRTQPHKNAFFDLSLIIPTAKKYNPLNKMSFSGAAILLFVLANANKAWSVNNLCLTLK